MLDLKSLVVLSAVGLAAYYLVRSLKLKERAQQAVENHCRQAGVQLLDGTVVQRGVRLVRDPRGIVALKREFNFEFTATGADRNQGWIMLRGNHIVSIELAPHKF